MGIFKRADSPYWWYRVQFKGKMTTGSTNTPDKKLALRIYLEKHHQFTEEYHLPSQRGKSTTFFWMCDQYLEKHAKVNKKSWKQDLIIIRKLKVRLGMTDLTFHMLRHNFATELIAKGADTRTVQEYMGHSSLKMLERCSHLNKGMWRSTIQLLGRDARPLETVR